MAKLLKALVIVILVLSAVALWLGIKLFGRREEIKGRVTKLENAVVALSTTIEAQAPEKPQRKPDLPAKDVSPVRAEAVDSPELSTFWDNYQIELEQLDQPALDLSQRKRDLMTYYQMVPATGKIARDPVTGQPQSTGPGTMESVLSELSTKAVEQKNRLNATRVQLGAVRTELADTITEVNQRKRDLRASMKNVDELKENVTSLTQDVKTQKDRADQIEQEKVTIEGQVAEVRRSEALLKEEAVEKDALIGQLKKDIAKLQTVQAQGPAQGPQVDVSPTKIEDIKSKLEPGVKGAVVAVNPTWNFVVLELTESFMHELLGEDLAGTVPAVDLMLKRPAQGEQPEKFVTKVRLHQVKKAERLAIADVLSDWQQVPAQAGDVLFH